MTDKKLLACRENLKKAREARQMNRLRPRIEAAFAALRPYRAREMAEAQAALAESRVELAALEPRIRISPLLSNFLDWIRARQRLAEEDF